MSQSQNAARIIEARIKSHRNGKRCDTIAAQAEFLEMSAPQWSRIRNGSVPLTDKMLRKICAILEKDTASQEALFREVKSADDPMAQRSRAVMAAVRLQIPAPPDAKPDPDMW